ncbi:MAG: hypothetical protein JNK82_43420 [Myxococcaceae bacterium]|nr:hypothetical protein [Myxococcaceae bacterium]
MNVLKRLLPLVMVTLATAANAQAVPLRIAFSARVTDNGLPLTGLHTLVVKLFDVPTGGSASWTETYTSHPANEGVMSVTLGSMTPLTAALFEGGALFAEVTVDATTLSPRLQLVSAPFAIRAASADRLGGNVAADFAPAAHAHPYLPLGAMLTCSGTEKMTGLTASGSVTCGPDATAALAGTGTATTAARSDHSHPGVYLPVGGSLTCTGTDKVRGIAVNGNVVCGQDADTAYTAGAGLTQAGTQFAVAFAGSGTATQAARSDHTHVATCPTAWLNHAGALCSGRFPSIGVSWNQAAANCAAVRGSTLCSYRELMVATRVAPLQPLTAGFWLGDRAGDNLVLRVNGPNLDDFDEQVDLGLSPAPTGSGYYCCTTPM